MIYFVQFGSLIRLCDLWKITRDLQKLYISSVGGGGGEKKKKNLILIFFY